MFEKYILCPDTLRNLGPAGGASGFAVDVRLAYYRGLALSMVEGFELSVDGEKVPSAAMLLRVGSESFDFEALATEAEARWEFDQAATLEVARPGGLQSGPHDIAVTEILRISYMPEPARRADRKTMQLSADGT